MKRNTFTKFFLTGAGLVVFWVVTSTAQAVENTFIVNAFTNCVDLDNQTMGSARFNLSVGKYIVYLTNNNMSCKFDNLDGACLITTVSLKVLAAASNANWVVPITTTPSLVVIANKPELSNEALQTYAYVTDVGCLDNTGTAELVFKSID